MKVRVPTPLRSYTDGAAVVESMSGRGATTVAAVLEDLDERYPGIRFRMVDEQGRIRPHMKVFLNDEAIRDLEAQVGPTDVVTIMQALSGG